MLIFANHTNNALCKVVDLSSAPQLITAPRTIVIRPLKRRYLRRYKSNIFRSKPEKHHPGFPSPKKIVNQRLTENISTTAQWTIILKTRIILYQAGKVSLTTWELHHCKLWKSHSPLGHLPVQYFRKELDLRQTHHWRFAEKIQQSS